MPAQGALLSGEISAATRLAAVIGDPVRHSLSPVIHNAAFSARDVDWVYVAAEVPAGRGAEAMAAAALLGYQGLSVTMPLKAEAARAATRRSPTVERLGAANCLVRRGPGWEAHNTDGAGLVADLRRSHGFEPSGRTALVIGAGGAARGVIDALVDAGCSTAVVARRAEAAATAVATANQGRSAGSAVAHAASAGDVHVADLVVNATPLGMDGHPGMPVAPDLVRTDALAVDLVYHPAETLWVRELRRLGVSAHNGVGMLVGQAAIQYELWTGVVAPIEAMQRAVADHLASGG